MSEFKNVLPALEGKSFFAVCLGAIGAIAIMLVLSLPVAALLHWTALSEALLPTLAVIIQVLALFGGGLYCGRKAGRRGLLHGLITGALVVVLLLLFGGLNLAGLPLKAAYCLVAAALGGVFGVK